MSHAKFILKKINIFVIVTVVNCSIDGLNYMDPYTIRPAPSLYPRGEDPCNPLYWYPRNIPEYCNYQRSPIPQKVTPQPPPPPMPVPMPQPDCFIPIPALPAPLPGLVQVPTGVQIAPINPLLPVPSPVYANAYASYPYQTNSQQFGMVPGLPGLVTKDGGINVLPFSDAYSDLLEKHKNRMIRRRLEKLIQDYEDFPNRRSYRRLKQYASGNF